jgi:7-carboxy-7-deazaguanine synthase (Cx14CxxC type)
MTTYHVTEIFKTLQGEGFWSGRTAVFCRFSRCNLWTGRERDRARAICQFCDTDFTHSDKYEGDELADAIEQCWGSSTSDRMVVFTGGEPMLQVNRSLVDAMKFRGFYVAIETNGTIPVIPTIDWVCVSPKVNAPLVVHAGDELKLVYPQGPDPAVYLGLKFDHYWLSPMDSPALAENTAAAIEYVMANPSWRLNTQSHKMIGIR